MQLNEQTLQGRWNEVMGQIRKKWGELNDDELEKSRGNMDQLVGAIQRQTGESRESIEAFLDRAVTQGSSMLNQVKETVQQFTRTAARQTSQAAASLGSQSQSAAEQANAMYQQAQATVKQRPVESILTCFGLGLITGVAISLMMRSD